MSWTEDHEDEFLDHAARGHDLVEVYFTDKKAETAWARLLVIDGTDRWVPKSVCGAFSQGSGRFDKSGSVEIEQWFLDEEGIDY